MKNDDLFTGKSNPISPTDSEEISAYIKSKKIVRRVNTDGTIDEIVLQDNLSKPDGKGGYIDTSIESVLLDSSGDPIKNPSRYVLSHSGLGISHDEEKGICGSIFHQRNTTRHYKIKYDGITPKSGLGRCSRCQWIHLLIYAAASVLGLCLLIGLYKGFNVF